MASFQADFQIKDDTYMMIQEGKTSISQDTMKEYISFLRPDFESRNFAD